MAASFVKPPRQDVLDPVYPHGHVPGRQPRDFSDGHRVQVLEIGNDYLAVERFEPLNQRRQPLQIRCAGRPRAGPGLCRGAFRVLPGSRDSKRSGAREERATRPHGGQRDTPRSARNSGHRTAESCATTENESPGSGRDAFPGQPRTHARAVRVRSRIGPPPRCTGHPGSPFRSSGSAPPTLQGSRRGTGNF